MDRAATAIHFGGARWTRWDGRSRRGLGERRSRGRRGVGPRGARDGDSLAARLTLAQALAWQGRGRDADAVLSEVDESTLTEADLMAWALPRAANQFWMLDQPERATAFLRADPGQGDLRRAPARRSTRCWARSR